jgi:hypothetical protein
MAGFRSLSYIKGVIVALTGHIEIAPQQVRTPS